jgi:hypothetical protein
MLAMRQTVTALTAMMLLTAVVLAQPAGMLPLVEGVLLLAVAVGRETVQLVLVVKIMAMGSWMLSRCALQWMRTNCSSSWAGEEGGRGGRAIVQARGGGGRGGCVCLTGSKCRAWTRMT